MITAANVKKLAQVPITKENILRTLLGYRPQKRHRKRLDSIIEKLIKNKEMIKLEHMGEQLFEMINDVPNKRVTSNEPNSNPNNTISDQLGTASQNLK